MGGGGGGVKRCLSGVTEQNVGLLYATVQSLHI